MGMCVLSVCVREDRWECGVCVWGGGREDRWECGGCVCVWKQ